MIHMRGHRADYDEWESLGATGWSYEDVLPYFKRAVYHPTGTCSIGRVVDPELRVYGFEGLRVIDASVTPTVPRGNTNAPTIMVGEKGADLLRRLQPLPRQHVPVNVIA